MESANSSDVGTIVAVSEKEESLVGMSVVWSPRRLFAGCMEEAKNVELLVGKPVAWSIRPVEPKNDESLVGRMVGCMTRAS